ncbi:MAG: SDR family oxidoreductase [Dissulfuribacterales bacterium]
MEKTKNQTKSKASSQVRNSKVTPIAVIGMGCLFPGSHDKEGYWRNITAGRNMVTEVPPSHFLIDHYFDPDPSVPDKTYCRQGAFLSPVEFDPMAFGIPPTHLAATDTSQLLSLLVARQVIENAFNGQLKHMDRSRIGVIMGVAAGLELLGEMANRLAKPNWIKGMREAGLPEDEVEDICKRIMATHAPWKESTFPGLLGNVVTGRIANYFDLGGINCTSDAACASSFSALSQGLNELYTGTSDVIIVGGADTNNDAFLFVSFSKTPALSPTHDCRPFSDKADGMVLGEGIGMIAIKRLDDAERDGDRIYAVIRGIGASSDGKGTSIYAPCAQGQAAALRRCYEAASYSPETVELLEAHGTATKPGDKAEVEALKTVFGHETLRQDKQWCALGSVKSQIGHTKSAAATAGIIKAVMGLHHKVLPPTIKVEQPSPLMEIEKSPFYVNTECRPWVRGDEHPRRASVSSFGFGGTNFHVTVEEYKGSGKSAWRLRNVPSELVVIGAENAKGLEDLCREAAKDLDTKGVLEYLARTSQERFDASCPARIAVIATDEKDLESKLNYAAKTLSEKPDSGFSLPNGLFCSVNKSDPGDIAFLFPGQGTSGCLDMGADLAMQFSDAMAVWDFSASFDQKRGAKEPLHKVVYPMPVFNEEDKKAQAEKLALTEWAQPAVMTTSISMSSILKGLDIKPDCVGGHSLGEISALHDAGVLDMESLFNVCFKRGELMARVRIGENHGTMTAVFCDAGKAQDILDKIGNAIIIANHNSPSQIVLSGPFPDMEAVEEALKKEKIKFRRLPVSAAFHSSIMNEACAPFLAYIKGIDFKKAKVPVYSNINGKPHQNGPDKIREALAKQIVTPVQFVKEIEEMYAAGVRTFIEVGSGCVLTNCVGKTLENKPHAAINMDTKQEHGITGLWKALAKLVIAGVTPDFSYLWKDYAPVSDPRKEEKLKFSVTLSGTNYGKPYPPPGGIKDFPKPNPPKPQIVPQIVDKEPKQLNAASNNTNNTVNAEAENQKSTQPEKPAPAISSTANAARGIPAAPTAPSIQQPLSGIGGAAPAPLSVSTTRKDNSSWVGAYQNIQQQTTDAHAAYLKVMAESHLSFLKAAESSNIALSALLTGQPAVQGDAGLPAMSTSAGITPESVPLAPSAPEYTPAAIPASVPPAPKPEAAHPTPAPLAAAPVQAPHPVAEQAPVPSNINFKEMLLDVVADKTGYPKEILTVEMDLELDLGIDSIKRVEIFSAINEENPWLPEVNPAVMAEIKTLGDVIDFIERSLGQVQSSGADSSITPAPALEAQTNEESIGIGRYVLRETPVPYSGFSMPGLAEADHMCIVDNETGIGIGVALAKELKKNGISAMVVKKVPDDCDGLIFLGGLRKIIKKQDAMDINREAFISAKKIAGQLTSNGGVFVTVQNTGGDFGLSGLAGNRVWLSGLTGLVKTAAIEWPKASVKAIDIDSNGLSPKKIASTICLELLTGGPELEVGLKSDGSRYRLKSYGAPANVAGTFIDENSVVVTSGGARGITAKALIQLARDVRPRLALIGRTEPADEPECCRGADTDAQIKAALLQDAKTNGKTVTPMDLNKQTHKILSGREIKSNLEAMRQAGSDVRYIVADVTSESDISNALKAVRKEWGAITGIVHGAGVLADKLIAEKTLEQFDRVFNTKVKGLRALLKATAKDDLRVICLFSSIAGRTGNMGQCDYSMANEILNKVADAEAIKRKGDCLVKSINWGPWDSGMVSPLLKAHFEEAGIPLIPVDVGVKCFVKEITENAPENVEVVIGPEPPEGSFAISPITRELNLSLIVNKEKYPFIDSHRIQDTPVLPVVMVIEWFARTAQLYNPDMNFVECRDLRVLRGIKLDNFIKGSDLFNVSCRQVNGDRSSLALELKGPDNAKNYSATIEMSAKNLVNNNVTKSKENGLPSWKWDVSDIYKNMLFHGPEFQVIKSLKGVSGDAATAVIGGIEKMSWPDASWKYDIAALDGGLQLARLWGIHNLNKKSLPTKIGAFYAYRNGPIAGPIDCVLSGKSIQNRRTLSDISFFDKEGRLAAKLCDVEMHMIADTATQG